jgi:hypothetical protein
MPEDSLEAPDMPDGGAGASGNGFGVAYVFAIACAGELQHIPLPEGGPPDAVPFGCFGANGAKLGPDDFVFAFASIFSFAELRNEHPVLDGLRVDGELRDFAQGFNLPRCGKKDRDDCKPVELDVVVESKNQQRDPLNLTAQGSSLGEQLYVQYFTTGGTFEFASVVVYDPRQGRLSNSENEYRAPKAPGQYDLWMVLRDNRGGVSWERTSIDVE